MSRSPLSTTVRFLGGGLWPRPSGSSGDLPAAVISASVGPADVGLRPPRFKDRENLASTSPINSPPGDLVAEVEALGERLSLVRERIGEVIFGQREVIEQALITLLSGGHALLIGVPGLAKTRLVETLGTILGVDDKRIQCTPDLMADEINRASPRTQSALLQAMQEGRVSIAGQYHPLPRPFHVLATQNPLEQEGTYPVPEAQLDRFLLQIDVDYPDREAERRMLIATTGAAEQPPRRVLS